MATARKQPVSHADVGAWVVKCNAVAVWDYFGKVNQLGVPLGTPYRTDWSLGITYRNELIEQGDLVLLWVKGRDGTAIHEVGVATGRLRVNVIDEDYLIDESLRDVDQEFIEYDGVRLARPVSRDNLLRDPLLARSEPIRAPQMTNPSYLTPEELAVFIKYFRPPDLRAAGWPAHLVEQRG